MRQSSTLCGIIQARSYRVKVAPDILATVRLFRSEDGGPKNTLRGDLRCPVQLGENYYDCQMQLWEVGPLEPGAEKHEVPICFLCPDLVKDKLSQGVKFQIWDGRIIGEGTVSEVFYESLSRLSRLPPDAQNRLIDSND